MQQCRCAATCSAIPCRANPTTHDTDAPRSCCDSQVAYCRILEIRTLNGKTQHPRWSVKAGDASLSAVVVLPFVPGAGGEWRVDRVAAGVVLVPLLSLGREVIVEELRDQSYKFKLHPEIAGGPLLQAICLDRTMFRANVMHAVHKRT